ncbi:MAG: aminomethyltransferase [Acidocella sp. 20-57-95]|nr:MAG: aminomethyltransferase [Acidocella sp. 20-57-95]OYV61829.1 MAG: aminomethyltransferase [Acidocella sp. 21-58-7]HQT62948.1 ferritin-like domain-containing protein [Acidocella sp.]HQU04079.1 ferritin-like domain-containing protein [Acidocella sp.]
MDDAIATADFNARHWNFPQTGNIQAGDATHYGMLTRLLIETYNPYKPAVLNWPKLEPDALARITSLPIWDIAVQTEIKASMRIEAFAATIKDPDLKAALLHMAREEARHKDVLSRLVAAYDIPLKPDEVYKQPRDPEWAFMVTGYSECVDSFFAYGLFEMARRSGYFPPELVETFEPVVQEEGRHILFFTNWIAWHKATMPLWRRPYFFCKIIAVWLFLIYERIGIAKDVDGLENGDANFTVNGSKALADEMDPATLIDICLEEDKKRMSGYDPRLLRPTTMPKLARFARLFIRPKKRTV